MLKDLISRYCDGWAKPAQPVAAAKPKKEEEEKPIVFDELMGVVVEEGQ
jgi:hypothetical protein